MTATTYSVAIGDDDPARLKAYLYAHTELVLTVSVKGLNRSAYVLRTTSEFANEADAVENAAYLAKYQCGRLGSGLYGILCEGVTQTRAFNDAFHWASHNVEGPKAKLTQHSC